MNKDRKPARKRDEQRDSRYQRKDTRGYGERRERESSRDSVKQRLDGRKQERSSNYKNHDPVKKVGRAADLLHKVMIFSDGPQ